MNRNTMKANVSKVSLPRIVIFLRGRCVSLCTKFTQKCLTPLCTNACHKFFAHSGKPFTWLGKRILCRRAKAHPIESTNSDKC